MNLHIANYFVELLNYYIMGIKSIRSIGCLALFVCLSYSMLANAQVESSGVIDTLTKRVINGLEVVPIRTSRDGVPFRWELRVHDFDSHFQKFEGRYAGSVTNFCFVDLDTTAPMSVREWEVCIWESIVPDVVKALDSFGIRLFIDKEGRVFTAEFSMEDKAFQKLNTLPQNTLKKLYQDLTKEECKAIKGAKIQRLDSEWNRFPSCSEGGEIEYITIFLGKTGIWRCDLP